ncbi:MAG: hypothetical protein WD048_07635 [Chitinophagales bacterium]
MKTIVLIASILLFTIPKLYSQETIIMRSYHEKRGADNRIEIYGPGEKYKRIDMGNWKISDDKEIQLLISKKIGEFNKQGYKLVSFEETLIDYAPYVLFFTYVFTKD